MDKTNDGGAAFPCDSIDLGDRSIRSGGMTLRDYFAAKAMQGFCVGFAGEGSLSAEELERQFHELGRYCYLLADALLKVRSA